MVRLDDEAREWRYGRQIPAGISLHVGFHLRLVACGIRRHLRIDDDSPPLGRYHRLLGGDNWDVVRVRTHHNSERQDKLRPQVRVSWKEVALMCRLFECPDCEQLSMFWNENFEGWECSNVNCGFFNRTNSEFNPPERRK